MLMLSLPLSALIRLGGGAWRAGSSPPADHWPLSSFAYKTLQHTQDKVSTRSVLVVYILNWACLQLQFGMLPQESERVYLHILHRQTGILCSTHNNTYNQVT